MTDSKPLTRPRGWMRRHPVAVTAIGTTLVLVAMVVGLWSKRGDFVDAFGSASPWTLAGAALIQCV